MKKLLEKTKATLGAILMIAAVGLLTTLIEGGVPTC